MLKPLTAWLRGFSTLRHLTVSPPDRTAWLVGITVDFLDIAGYRRGIIDASGRCAAGSVG